MTIQQLIYVVALDQHRGFVRAAEECHVTQPTLSMQVKKLEEEWGVTLFQRGQGPLVPTSIGAEVVEKARSILAEVHALEELIRGEKEALGGHLELAIIPTLSPYLLPRFIHRFAEAHPDLSISVRELQSEQIIAGLHSGALDAGLLALPVGDEEIEELPLFREPLWLCASSGFPEIELNTGALRSDWAGAPLVLTGGNCLREQVLQYCGMSEPGEATVTYEGGSIETLMRLVGSGQGYTLVPELAIPEQMPQGTVIRAFHEPAPEREIGLVVHRRFVRRRLIERLGQAVRERVPESFLTRKGMRLTWRR